ncbi:hypothetical protein [Vibrio sp. ABG19]|uniref:hypothetical protein n=1 Tax=Vibrio sp. ABG19 TaxID=2817385 RepID=UPI00249ED388|nr:hypothetical protein [Vibrio sp. ABG19]WGY47390.1 hypothetical protein J0X00_06865 [Vibrio sp. ABG19]
MEKEKFNNLCSHYKDSFDNHKISIKQRDMLFYFLLVILSVFTLQLSSTETVATVVTEYVKKSTGVGLSGSIGFISTLLWFLLMGFSIRYFQVVIEIERQYDYLHALETEINGFYKQDSIAFTREGKLYLSKYPLFSNWVWLLYTLFFPILILSCAILKIKNQTIILSDLTANQIIDMTCFVLMSISILLYTYRLHESKVNEAFSRVARLF